MDAEEEALEFFGVKKKGVTEFPLDLQDVGVVAGRGTGQMGGAVGEMDDGGEVGRGFDAGAMVVGDGVDDERRDVPAPEQGGPDSSVVGPKDFAFGIDAREGLLGDKSADFSPGFGREKLIENELADVMKEAGGEGDRRRKTAVSFDL